MRHPLERFRFCPVCGSGRFSENDFKSKRCDDCGFVYYANACAATASFIMRNGSDGRRELLVARRAKEPARGTLDLPGGFVDMDETTEQGMRREIMEETGLTVDRLTYLFSLPNRYLFSGLVVHTVDLFFTAEVDSDAQPVAADDAAALMWLPADRIDPTLFGLDSIRKAVEQYTGKNSQHLSR